MSLMAMKIMMVGLNSWEEDSDEDEDDKDGDDEDYEDKGDDDEPVLLFWLDADKGGDWKKTDLVKLAAWCRLSIIRKIIKFV